MALCYRAYGALEAVLNVESELPMPVLTLDTDVLVRVHAASLNPADLKHCHGELKLLVQRDMPVCIGFDFSGVVHSVGPKVTDFKVGDEVFGDVVGIRTGTVAHYAVVDSRVIAKKPTNLTHVQAAGAPLAGITALQCLQAAHCSKDKEGATSVLITGGAGGVGSYAIQIAKQHYKCAFVATTASAGAKMELCQKLGADRVFDYRKENIAQVLREEGLKFDVIVDCTGEASKLAPFVKAGGGMASILSHPTSEILNAWLEGSVGPGVHISSLITSSVWALGRTVDVFTGARSISSALARNSGGATFKHIITIPDKEVMHTLAELLQSGSVVPQVDSVYPLTQAKEAALKLEEGHAAGKVIVTCI
jgi:alcohol dehydrogenase